MITTYIGTAAQKAGAARKAAGKIAEAERYLAQRDNGQQAWNQRVDHQWVLGAARRAIRALVISDTARAEGLRNEAIQILTEGIEWSLARAAAAPNEDEKEAEMLVLQNWVLNVDYLQQYVRPVIDAWTAEQAPEEAVNVTPEQEATPEAMKRVFVAPDGRTLTVLHPEGRYRATTARLDELRDEYAEVTIETIRAEWHLSLRHVYGPTMPSHIARASRLELLVCHGNGSVPEATGAPETAAPAPEALDTTGGREEANEGVGVDYVLQALVGDEWQDCVTGPDEAMVRELLTRFDATYPGREHRVISRPRTVEYLVELQTAQDAVEALTADWIEAAHRYYIREGSLTPFRCELSGHDVVLTADLDAEQWRIEAASERGVARFAAATLGDVRIWLYDLLLDEPGERDDEDLEDEEATYEVQGLYGAKWETETHASDRAEADELLNQFRRCAPGRPYRVLVRYPMADGPWM